MNVVDLLLVGAIVVFAVTGWRQGLVRGVLSMCGFIIGAVAGVLLVPPLLDHWSLAPLERGLVSVSLVLLLAFVGQLAGAVAGRALHARLTWHPAQVVDAVGGTLFSLVALALVVWVAAAAVAVLPDGGVASQVRSSRLLTSIDSVVPDVARAWAGGLRDAIDGTAFPRVFAGIVEPQTLPVDPPDPALVKNAAVRRAWGSLVRVEGAAPRCGEQVSGSGFVYAPHLVMTNAHVVAGVDAPKVRVLGTGVAYDAQVVLFDARTDVAVLLVPDLVSRSLPFAGKAHARDPGVVAGFPGGGKLTVVPARVRNEIEARGQDIYGGSTVLRDVYALRAQVRPGNSGGPLLAPDGSVYGVVFAASLDDADTGYALTADQVHADAVAGTLARTPVSTGSCLPAH